MGVILPLFSMQQVIGDDIRLVIGRMFEHIQVGRIAQGKCRQIAWRREAQVRERQSSLNE
jgi:hypothetical protein